MAGRWDGAECLPVARRQLLHVRVPSGDNGLAERLEAVPARHPGSDEGVLHVLVGSREVTVHAGRYHVQAGAALEAELDELGGPAATTPETMRPEAPSDGTRP